MKDLCLAVAAIGRGEDIASAEMSDTRHRELAEDLALMWDRFRKDEVRPDAYLREAPFRSPDFRARTRW